ncbi:sigma factor [Egicoccus sp. AB-alg2]|uniref:sigma factor n=1 Tax=Egicoccus sp. AB-alg2 TaxID=3242693 RepID=UPI00359D4CE4
MESDDVAVTGHDFDEVYTQHAEATLAVVIALRGARVGVEDVVQEAFTRALQRWDQVGAMERPDLWIQRVALNLATSRLRRLASERRALERLRRHRAAIGSVRT